MHEVALAGSFVPPAAQLESGDHMTQEEFLRAYERTPDHFKAELVGGIVFVASPLRNPHATADGTLGGLFFYYSGHTPGVQHGNNATVLLGDGGVPQPDQYLRILPQHGGQSRTTADEYVEGAPELVAEISHATRALDLHEKRADYAQYGVKEYLVWCLEQPQLRWFDMAQDRELMPDADGIYRIRTFPGLWINGAALLGQDFDALMSTLNAGLATPEHTEFVQRLSAAKH